MLPVETPFKTYTGLDGKPLDNGYVYFGQPNQNPITAPVTVYWDAARTQPAAQPLRTKNGYIVRAGTPANVFYDDAYSELVLDSKKRQVFYARTSDDFSIAAAVSNLSKPGGAGSIGYSNGGTATTVAQALDILFFGVANVRNPKYAGGAKGGGNDDTAAFRAAIASGLKIVYAPSDTYLTDTLTIPVDVSVIGDGMRQTIIQSKAIGGSLFKVSSPDGVQVGCFRDMQLVGNGLTGANGNGHAINFIDPQFNTGAFTPQGMTVERVWIRNFRGQESRDNSGANKIWSAGIICVEGLQNIYRDVYVHNCGHGFYLERAQTNKITNCTVFLCDGWGIFTYQCVAPVIDKCDIAGNGALGTADPGFPVAMGMGNVGSCQDEGWYFTNGSKVKNTNGTAQIYLNTTNGAVADKSWIRSDADVSRANVVNNGIYAIKCPGLKVKDNIFSHVLAAGTTPAAGKAKIAHFVTDYVNGVFDGEFTGNTFPAQAGLLTEYNLCMEGLIGNTCIFAGWDISFNRFGTPLVIGAAQVVDVDILVKNAAFTHSRVRNNVHYAQTNVTRTRGISGENLSANNNLDIGANLFQQDGGTISDNYFGFLYPTLRLASGTFDPPSLAPGAVTTTTLAVNNALLGEPVQAFFTVPLQGVIFTAWVSVAGTVTVQAFNPTAAAIDLGSGSVGVIVSRTSVAEAD